MVDIIQRFSIPIGVEIIEEDLSELRSCKKFTQGTPQGTKGSWNVLEDYPFSKAVILNHYTSFMRSLGHTHNFQITTSWITRNNKGDRVQLHSHYNCYWSGVFYFGDYDDNSGRLDLWNPIAALNRIHLNAEGDPTTDHMSIAPATNLLVLFPAYIQHQVDGIQSDLTRYSLAFNFMPIGEFGWNDSKFKL